MGFRLVFWPRSWGALACSLVLALAAQATAQDSSAVIDYMLDHRVGFSTATGSLGVSMFDVAEELGYDGILGFIDANRELSLLHAECWLFDAQTPGTAGDMGLTRAWVTDFFRLRAANDLSFLPECDSDGLESMLAIDMQVWTVGRDYPVAYHVSFKTSIYPDYEGRPASSGDSAWLGYASESRLATEVRDIVETAVRDLALKLIKVRGLRR